MVSSTVHTLEQQKTADGIHLKGIQSFLEQVENSGIEIKKPAHLGDDYFKEAIKDPYLINYIESRFDDKSVMAAFDLYNPSKLPPVPKNPSTEDIEFFLMVMIIS